MIEELKKIRDAFKKLNDSDVMDCSREDPWFDEAVDDLHVAIEDALLASWKRMAGVRSEVCAERAAAALCHPSIRFERAGLAGKKAYATDGHAILIWDGAPMMATEQQVPIGSVLKTVRKADGHPPMEGTKVMVSEGLRAYRFGDAYVNADLVERWLPMGHDAMGLPTGGMKDPVLFRGDSWDLVVMGLETDASSVTVGWSEIAEEREVMASEIKVGDLVRVTAGIGALKTVVAVDDTPSIDHHAKLQSDYHKALAEIARLRAAVRALAALVPDHALDIGGVE